MNKNFLNKNFWNGMQEEGFMLVNAPSRKLAVFPSTGGQICISSSDFGSCGFSLEIEEVDALIQALQSAKSSAIPISAEIQTMYAIHCAKMGEKA